MKSFDSPLLFPFPFSLFPFSFSFLLIKNKTKQNKTKQKIGYFFYWLITFRAAASFIAHNLHKKSFVKKLEKNVSFYAQNSYQTEGSRILASKSSSFLTSLPSSFGATKRPKGKEREEGGGREHRPTFFKRRNSQLNFFSTWGLEGSGGMEGEGRGRVRRFSCPALLCLWSDHSHSVGDLKRMMEREQGGRKGREGEESVLGGEELRMWVKKEMENFENSQISKKSSHWLKYVGKSQR